MADALAALTGAAVVLKGMGSLVAMDGEKTYTNTTGNPGMATGGSGDVLTGMIAGLWGQKQPDPDSDAGFRRLTATEAAVSGVFLHGLAGDLAAEKLGEYGLTAGDIAGKTPLALKKILEG
jgi:NAD(P)H-hydrate epimerase